MKSGTLLSAQNWMLMSLRLFLILLTPMVAHSSDEDSGWERLVLESSVFDHVVSTARVEGPQVFEFYATPIRAEGVVTACGYAFQVLLLDWAYSSNKPAVVYGSLIYQKLDDKFVTALKIGITDIEERSTSLWQRHSSPSYAYIRRGGTVMAGHEVSSSSSGGDTKLFMIESTDSVGLFLEDGPVTVAFNRSKGGFDLEFDLPIEMFSTSGMETARCFGEMAWGTQSAGGRSEADHSAP